jgi:CheY-like chemotaxis protein
MAKYILVASPDTSFGETLRTGLQDEGGYSVHLAANGAEVLASIGNLSFDGAIIDSLISDLPLPSLVDAIRLKHPYVKVLVIPPTDPFSTLTLEDCGADNFINKPVFIPDLLEIIRGLLKPTVPGATESGENPFQEETTKGLSDIMGDEIAKIDWDSDNLPSAAGDDYPDTLVLPLEDVIAKTQGQISVKTGPKKNTGALQEIPPEQFLEMEELAKWFSESTARSAMLVGRGEVVATNGEIDGDRQKKFAREVSERLQTSNARELIRYIPPQQGTGNELLFSSVIDTGKFLVLTYDADISYSVIREQAERLRKRLVEGIQTAPVKAEDVTNAWSAEAGETPGENFAIQSEIPEQGNGSHYMDSAVPPISNQETQSSGIDQILPETDLVVEAIPRVMPSSFNIENDFPLPDSEPRSGDLVAEDEYPWLAAGAVSLVEGASDNSVIPEGFPSDFPWEEPLVKEVVGQSTSEPEPVAAILSDGTQVDKTANAESELDENLADQEPGEKITTAELELKNPPEGGIRNLRVFLLIPADPRVFLTGKLAAELGDWIPQVCQSMNWEVDALAVRPEFVRVGLIAEPDQLDDQIVVTLQDATTRLVAANYPQMALDPDKPLFWADDFLKINPNDPPDQNELNAFIRHLRH